MNEMRTMILPATIIPMGGAWYAPVLTNSAYMWYPLNAITPKATRQMPKTTKMKLKRKRINLTTDVAQPILTFDVPNDSKQRSEHWRERVVVCQSSGALIC
jgi:hypothetical protein